MNNPDNYCFPTEVQLHTLADLADEISMADFLKLTQLGSKSAEPERTDQKINLALMTECLRISPGAGFMGEEGTSGLPSRVYWCVDPIDHTRNFRRGLGLWSTQIAYVADEKTIAAVVSAPAIGKRWVSNCKVDNDARQNVRRSLRDCFVSVHNPRVLASWGVDMIHFHRLWDSVGSTLGLGNSVAHCLVAEHKLDAAISAGGSSWDYRSLARIVRTAGGVFRILHHEGKYGMISAASESTLDHLIDPLRHIESSDAW